MAGSFDLGRRCPELPDIVADASIGESEGKSHDYQGKASDPQGDRSGEQAEAEGMEGGKQMKAITVEFPDECTELEAATYATGCFNPSQNDYKKLEKGYRQGVRFSFCDGRLAYLYRDMQGNYVLQIRQKE